MLIMGSGGPRQQS